MTSFVLLLIGLGRANCARSFSLLRMFLEISSAFPSHTLLFGPALNSFSLEAAFTPSLSPLSRSFPASLTLTTPPPALSPCALPAPAAMTVLVWALDSYLECRADLCGVALLAHRLRVFAMEWGRGRRVSSEVDRISTVGVGGSYSLRGDTPHAVGDPKLPKLLEA